MTLKKQGCLEALRRLVLSKYTGACKCVVLYERVLLWKEFGLNHWLHLSDMQAGCVYSNSMFWSYLLTVVLVHHCNASPLERLTSSNVLLETVFLLLTRSKDICKEFSKEMRFPLLLFLIQVNITECGGGMNCCHKTTFPTCFHLNLKSLY